MDDRDGGTRDGAPGAAPAAEAVPGPAARAAGGLERRPGCVTAYIIGGAVFAIGMLVVFGSGMLAVPNPRPVFRVLYLAEAVLMLFACQALWRREPHGRTLAMVAAGLGALLAAAAFVVEWMPDAEGAQHIDVLQILALLGHYFVYAWFRRRKEFFAGRV
jgi:hypothetical protein